MRAGERGFLLLTSQLGDPDRKPLTVAQFRTLTQRMRDMSSPSEPDSQLTVDYILSIGYDRAMAERIVGLLEDEIRLESYLRIAERKGCVPVTRVSDAYPQILRNRLGADAPGSLWAKGDLSLLDTPMIALVGSRNLRAANKEFAYAVGREAARQGYTLVSGNARGADKTAQDACLEWGGKVISIVADELENCSVADNILYLSEDSFDLPFSALRALSRNRVIHAMGHKTFVAQCTYGKGGTWDGTVKNLRHNISPVFCFADGSAATAELEQLGATLIATDDLLDFSALHGKIESFLD